MSDSREAELPKLEAPKLGPADLPEVGNAPPPEKRTFLVPAEQNEFGPLTPIRNYEEEQATQEALLQEDVPQRPLIAPLEPMEVLRAEYEGGSQQFVKQIDWLKEHGYAGLRRTRGDGDCFYRSLAYAYIERIMLSDDKALAVASAISALESSLPLLKEAGFQELVYEDFYDCLVSLINRIITPEADGQLLTPITLLEAFNTPEVSNSIVVYLRLLTSAQIRADTDAYAGFLFHPEIGEPMVLPEFCENFVEAVGKEADHVQITALSRALKVNISVAYLDGHLHGSEEGTVDFVEFQNSDASETERVTLLYRPGHYDILDRRSEDFLE